MKATIVITAIIVLGVMECFALSQGINGTLFTIVAVIISGLAGLVLPTPKVLGGK